MALTSQNVERALQEFYCGASSTRNEAHEWLKTAQISQEAWNFCWDLLRPEKPSEIQFFGASSLHVKITKYWHEIPSDQYESLRQRLVEFVINYAKGPKIILNRICIALSSYVVLTIGERWKEAVPEIISTFQPQNCTNLSVDESVGVLLEILSVLPEEFQTMVLPRTYRGVARQKLDSATSQVLGVLEYVLNHGATSTDLRLRAIRCFTSWAQMGVPLPECDTLLTVVLRCISNDALCDDALDCLAAVVVHPDADKYSNSLRALIGNVTAIDAILSKSISDGDDDRCYNIYSLFVALGEAHSKLILMGALQNDEFGQSASRLIQLLLQCTATPGQYPVDETCSSLVVNFWYILQEDIVSSDADVYGDCVEKFVPVYSSLVEILLTKCMFPPDADYRTWSLDDQELFRIYRQDIGDTLVYCYKILDESLLQLLCTRLDAVLIKHHSNPNEWQLLEACFFAFESVAEGVSIDENNTLPLFFTRLSNIPLNNAHVASAALSAIGAYNEWIQERPQILSFVMPLLVQGLTDEAMAPAATRALKDISHGCQRHMGSFAGQILLHSQRALLNGTLRSSESVRLMCTVGRVLSILRDDEILPYLNELLTPLIRELHSLAKRNGNQDLSKLHSRVIMLLNMLGLLFANLDINLTSLNELDENGDGNENVCIGTKCGIDVTNRPQPILLVLQQIMPIIRDVSLAWNTDDAVVEAVCDVFKKAISTLMDACLPLMAEILELMIKLYQNHPLVAILDLVKQFLLLFGKDEIHIQMLREAFVNIVQVTLNVFESAMSDNTDLVQGFFQVLVQLLKKNAGFLQQSAFNQATFFQCGVVAISLPEAHTVKAASSFLATYINQSRDNKVMADVVNQNGKLLVERSLRCIGGEGQRDTVEYMSDIFLSLNKTCFQELCQWMTACLHQDGFPSPRLSFQQREHYTRLILTEKVNKRKLKEVVTEFSLVCRGIMGTEYATQTTPALI